MIKPDEMLPGWVAGWPKGAQPLYAHFDVVHLEGTPVAVVYYVGDDSWYVAVATDTFSVQREELRPGMFLPEPRTIWYTGIGTGWSDPLAAQAWVMLHGPEKLVLELTGK